eukprot:TRINITY_DN67081_c0_g1_i1.p1 TRINITY_DN67081_c0_g1~~TRINITY_DN67081_c0_g1_i1.p1  ORF type:complete len:1253 (-),score=163.34 TRINITY_DN67081_c0_g1_i1:198-3956(-)
MASATPAFWDTSRPPEQEGAHHVLVDTSCRTLSVSLGLKPAVTGHNDSMQDASGNSAIVPYVAQAAPLSAREKRLLEVSPNLLGATLAVRHRKSLAVPKNLLSATFADAQYMSPGVQWLQQKIVTFNNGGKRQRKQVLEEFLDKVEQSGASGLEELFSSQAQLLLVRLTSWFAVTLPILYELPLQLKVFLTFLEFREMGFVKAFFESGVVEPLLHTLSIVCDASDEVRCLVIEIFHRLASGGHHHKELLCSQGLVPALAECITSGGLRWGPMKQAGSLLYLLFTDNPHHQGEVLDTLQGLMAQKMPLAQRIGTKMILDLFANESRNAPQFLRDRHRYGKITELALAQLGGCDLHVASDAFLLLGRMLRLLNCDDLLLDFARAQLRKASDSGEEWLRLEIQIDESCSAPPPARHRGASTWLHRCVAQVLAMCENENASFDKAGASDQQNCVLGDLLGGHARDDPSMIVKAIVAEHDTGFSQDAGHVLRWGLVLCLAKRRPAFCKELVDMGLTETLLMSLLDSTRPVRQAVALVELHRLRLLSQRAQHIVEAVLSEDMLRAVTVDDFEAAADASALARARYRLRNLRTFQSSSGQTRIHGRSHDAKELHLRQRLVEKAMTPIMELRPPSGGDAAGNLSVFLTSTVDVRASSAMTREGNVAHNRSKEGGSPVAAAAVGAVAGAAVADGDASREAMVGADDSVPRHGAGRYDVRRVPVKVRDINGTGDGSLLAWPGGSVTGGEYQILMGSTEDAPVIGSTVSLLIDLADASSSGTVGRKRPVVVTDALGSLIGSVPSAPSRSGGAAVRTLSGTGDDRSKLSLNAVEREAADVTGAGSGAGSETAARRRRRLMEGPPKASHKLTQQEKRAIVLRPLPPPGIEARLPSRDRRGTAWKRQSLLPPSRAESEETELSLRMAGYEDDIFASYGIGSQQSSKIDQYSDSATKGGLDIDKFDPLGIQHSLAETSVGPEPSGEMPSSIGEEMASKIVGSAASEHSCTFGRHVTSQDTLTAEPSWMSFIAEDSALHEDSQFTDAHSCSHVDKLRLSDAVNVQKGGSVALVEVRGSSRPRSRLPPRERSASAGTAPATPPKQMRKVLHVIRAPYHECVAFHSGDVEKTRGVHADAVTNLLHPSTRRKFTHLKDAGGFPRKVLVGSGGGVGSFSARGPPRPPSPYRSGTRSAQTQREDSGSASKPGARSARVTASVVDEIREGAGQSLSSAVDVQPFLAERWTRIDVSRSRESSLVDYFPASARSLC